MLTKNPLEQLANQVYESDIFHPSIRSLTASLFLFTAIPGIADTHSQLPTTPCDIRIVFGSDAQGMPSVGYKLSMQISNRTARDIAGVSVYWLDDKSAIIGNSAATCDIENEAIGPSETGPCEAIIQQIGGVLLQRLGQTTWTDIINHQLTNFNSVTHCAIIGYKYGGHKLKTY